MNTKTVVKLKGLLTAIFLLFLLYPFTAWCETLKGVVRSVYDGDTVLLVGGGNGKVKIRLYGIDAPETSKPGIPGQPFGGEAKKRLMYKILGRNITAEVIDKDQYGRVVAVIQFNGRDINREMVAEGYAWAYRNYLKGAYASEYINAESSARSKQAGLWKESNPLPPWEFRQALKPHGRKHR